MVSCKPGISFSSEVINMAYNVPPAGGQSPQGDVLLVTQFMHDSMRNRFSYYLIDSQGLVIFLCYNV